MQKSNRKVRSEKEMLLANTQKRATSRTVGLIIVNGHPIPCEIDSHLLMFDVYAWAKSLIHSYSEKAQEFEGCGDTQTARDFQSIVEQLKQWLANSNFPVQSLPEFNLRKRFELLVNKNNLNEYVSQMLASATHTDEEVAPEFLLLADETTPVLYTISDHRQAARHSGDSILGIVVSQKELGDKLLATLMQFAPSFNDVQEHVTNVQPIFGAKVQPTKPREATKVFKPAKTTNHDNHYNHVSA